MNGARASLQSDRDALPIEGAVCTQGRECCRGLEETELQGPKLWPTETALIADSARDSVTPAVSGVTAVSPRRLSTDVWTDRLHHVPHGRATTPSRPAS